MIYILKEIGAGTIGVGGSLTITENDIEVLMPIEEPMTQAEYDAIPVKNPDAYYFIKP